MADARRPVAGLERRRAGRGARGSRREEGGCREHPTDEQRRVAGCIARRRQRQRRRGPQTSGASPGNRVEVQVLSSAPLCGARRPQRRARQPSARTRIADLRRSAARSCGLLRTFLHPPSGLALRLRTARPLPHAAEVSDGGRAAASGGAGASPSRARRPRIKARGGRMSGTSDRRATQSRGMHRPAQAAPAPPRAADLRS